VPWPPDYGGAIDMMNRIMLLKRSGIGIHLHYFSYNERGTPTRVEPSFVKRSIYIERKMGRKGFSLQVPYIISSRTNDELVANLQQDDHPILLEGIHCTGILRQMDIKTDEDRYTVCTMMKVFTIKN